MLGFSPALLSQPPGATAPASSLHADTLSYCDRLLADGEAAPSDEQLAVIDAFVRGCYEDGLRSDNISILEEFGFWGGLSLNAAMHKLWMKAGNPGKLTPVNFVSGDFSPTTGLNPGNSKTKFCRTGAYDSQFTASDTHLSFWHSTPPVFAQEREIGCEYADKWGLIASYYGWSYYRSFDIIGLDGVPYSYVNGLLMGAASTASSYLARNGVVYRSSDTGGYSGASNVEISIFKAANEFSAKSCFQWSIGRFMTQYQAAQFYNRSLALQQGLGRL